MKAVVQRVAHAEVSVDGAVTGKIGMGLLVLIGITHNDNFDIVKWMAKKIVNLRIFPDSEDKMNKSILDFPDYGILLISNFTVYGEISNGFRPSFSEAAGPEQAEQLYNKLIDEIKNNYPVRIQCGIFGTMMKVSLVNDGPVTLIIEK